MVDGTIHFQQSILDALDAGLIVLDRDRRIVHWNAWMVSASGYTAANVQGKLLDDVFQDAVTGQFKAAIASALDSGGSSLLTHALHPLLFPLKTRAGRKLLHDITVSAIRATPQPMCLVHISDVTMAARRERYLRDRQNARYDAVVASAPDVILTLDGDGVVRFANRAAVVAFGYSEKELIGTPAAALFEVASDWEAAWQCVLGDGALRQPVELVARRKDRSPCYFSFSASRWRDASHVFVTAILRDINEQRAAAAALMASEERSRRNAVALADLNQTLEQRVVDRTAQLLKVEEALRQSQKMEALGQLTGGIAHDFNNLLQGITGALDLVQKRIVEGRIVEIDRFVKGALASVSRASALTHRLLAFSRRQPVDPRPVELNQLVRTMDELLRRSIGEKIRMQINEGNDLWLVRCDPNQMENALLNLAINARDAMPDGGALTIATSNEYFDSAQASIRGLEVGEHVRLTIRDSGVGMAPEVQARAFDPFYTTKPVGQGTGLGLSMIYGFVRQSHGSVRIESEIGKGSTIEVCLPRYEGKLESAVIKDVSPGGAPSTSNEVVLVVEDEHMVRLMVVEVLKDLGYRALEASDGAAGLRILQSSQRVDLLITDIGLPEIDGRQLADAARAVRSDLKVLFMTGYAQSAASGELLGKGMQLMIKPFSMDKLTAKIREMVENSFGSNSA
jgi:PAS domain S-box-containing protein